MIEIEEMSKIICNTCEMGRGFDGYCAENIGYKVCIGCRATAQKLFELGYRKNEAKRPSLIEFNGQGDQMLFCPNCKHPIINVWSSKEYKPQYCHYCGQKLDWRVK